MERTVEEIGAKMDALGLWEAVQPFNWAVKPYGTAFPYFCSVFSENSGPVKIRVLMLEGWQTLHDYVRTRVDSSFGYYSSPSEMPHFELVVLKIGEMKLLRHDPGYLPVEASAAGRELAARILWESYGVMLRIETDRTLPLRFAGEKAVFARVETAQGVWEDAPLEIPDPRPQVEKVEFAASDVKTAKDLPFVSGLSLEIDFRVLPRVATGSGRPKCVYALVGVDCATGETVFSLQSAVHPEAGLKGLWESVPPQLLKVLIKMGRVPGDLKLVSARLFRLLRPICLELPVKLSMHDSLPRLERAFNMMSIPGLKPGESEKTNKDIV